jgi:hypothetical protein
MASRLVSRMALYGGFEEALVHFPTRQRLWAPLIIDVQHGFLSP